MNETASSELRSGSTVEFHALVLSSVTLQESNKLVTLLTREHGKISAIAAGAARSTKRFGASLDVTSHILAQLRVPRLDSRPQEAPLWRILRADIKSDFLHLRTAYQKLESAFFVVRLVKDLIPEGHYDPLLFKAVGRFLRDTEILKFDNASLARWVRIAFWTWLAHHLGFGNLSADLESKLSAQNPETAERFVHLWHSCLARDEPDFGSLFSAFANTAPPKLESVHEVALYQRWVDLSGIHWDHFEEWLQLKKFS